jgi:hypothetical protein
MQRILTVLTACALIATGCLGRAAPAGTPTAVPALTLTVPAGATSSNPAPATPVTPGTSVAPLPTLAEPQNPGAPDVADYTIAVTLDPAARSLTGSETLVYRNTARQPFAEMVFHLYLNAFKSLDTTFMKESGGQLRGDQFDPQNNGWIEVSAIRVKGGPDLKLEVLDDGTLARAKLPSPVAPGQSVTLELEFHAQLPAVFARTGWALDEKGDPFFLVGQWFPKPGVWSDTGWAADIFHGNAEFFADFGSYEVSISLPENYVTGATGMPVRSERGPGKNQTVTYRAAGVIDFAWVASPNLKASSRKQGQTEIQYLVLPEHSASAYKTLNIAATALRRYSDWYGPYPYQRLTIVDVPDMGSGAGGMEYPTFVTTGTDTGSPGSGWTDYTVIVTAHEIAHQWWQSMVATNEGREPWLDEGFADYSTVRLMVAEYGLNQQDMDQGRFQPGLLESRRRTFLRDPSVPMEGKAWDFPDWSDYTIAAYAKPVLALMTLERALGEQTMLKIFSTYFTRYRFAHPTTADFRKVAQEVSGQKLDWFFEGLVYHGQTINFIAHQVVKSDTITIDRQGELPVPADVLVKFNDGSAQTVTCQPGPPACVFTFPGRTVESYAVDPTHKLVIELDWMDNTGE